MDQHARAREALDDRPRRLDAVAARHLDVEQGDVDLVGHRRRHHLVAAGDLRDDDRDPRVLGRAAAAGARVETGRAPEGGFLLRVTTA